ncbi:hypothetical protein D3C75_728420 [compost metagenome]
MLQIGIGHEADGCIKSQGRLHGGNLAWVKGQHALEPKDQIHNDDHHRIADDQGSDVLLPALLVLLDASQRMEGLLQPAKPAVKPAGPVIEYVGYIESKRTGQQKYNNQSQGNGEKRNHSHGHSLLKVPVRISPGLPAHKSDITA